MSQGQGSGSKQSSPLALRHIDADLKDRGRRRSSAHSIIDEEDVPLTHKTGTVGIVALALRNRNEKKKEAEFKVLNQKFFRQRSCTFQAWLDIAVSYSILDLRETEEWKAT